ncbi:hypothetical protein PVAP13_9KG179439 [Panicum virgatum]|uniref:Uncharacterized protein n=1 Tax=Panicum virgatum TaxID=38727 RepID=A0A8T0NHT6_PANVG|nr:hypothetical protein PVAP13_9KG179439 [Panicum virgatum]
MLAHDIFLFLSFPRLRKQVGVHKIEQSPKHTSLHFIYADNTRGVTLLHCAKELCAKYRRSGCKHAPVRCERRTSDIEHHVSALLGQEEITKMLVQVGRGHSNKGRGGSSISCPLSAKLIDDDDVAPHRERIIPEMLGCLKFLPFYEISVPPPRGALEGVHFFRCQRRRILPDLHVADETEFRLRFHCLQGRLSCSSRVARTPPRNVEDWRRTGKSRRGEESICESPLLLVGASITIGPIQNNSRKGLFWCQFV